MSSRQELVNQASPDALNKLARSYGFPSAQAMQRVIELGDHISRGGKVTDKWVDKMAEVYPRVPREVLQTYAQSIKTLPDLAKAVGVDAATAHEYVTNYASSRVSQDISAKLDKTDAFSQSRATHGLKTISKTDTSLRDQLTKQVPPDIHGVPSHIRRDLTANGLEKNVALTRERSHNLANDESRYGGTSPSNRSIDVALAYDKHVLNDFAENELQTMDVEQELTDEPA